MEGKVILHEWLFLCSFKYRGSKLFSNKSRQRMLYIPSRLSVFLVPKNYELSSLSCNSTFSHANLSKDVTFCRYYYCGTKLVYDKSREFYKHWYRVASAVIRRHWTGFTRYSVTESTRVYYTSTTVCTADTLKA